MRKIALIAAPVFALAAACGGGDAPERCDELSDQMIERINGGTTGTDSGVGGYIASLPTSERDFGYSAVAAVELESGPVTLLALGSPTEPPILAVGKDARRAFTWGSNAAADAPIGRWRDSVVLASDASSTAISCFKR